MIRYRLNCASGHDFESWFASGADFDRLEAAGLLSCSVCGSSEVEKAVMAPQLAQPEPGEKPLSKPASPAEQALRELRTKFEARAENVGRSFAKEARRIHDGDAPERPIYGEARLDDARGLIEDGIPVAPLPWRSGRDN